MNDLLCLLIPSGIALLVWWWYKHPSADAGTPEIKHIPLWMDDQDEL